MVALHRLVMQIGQGSIEYDACVRYGHKQPLLNVIQAVGDCRHQVVAHIEPGPPHSLKFVDAPEEVRQYGCIPRLRLGLFDESGNQLSVSEFKNPPTMALQAGGSKKQLTFKAKPVESVQNGWQFPDVYLTKVKVGQSYSLVATLKLDRRNQLTG